MLSSKLICSGKKYKNIYGIILWNIMKKLWVGILPDNTYPSWISCDESFKKIQI